ncbi:MAG: hypothetical protein EBV30_09130, partial [Actinobacteria bacterium]|nr:hypothetical protein [Actinomycetota bacterium]
MSKPIHIFDAIARDQKVIRATEDTMEVEYFDEDDMHRGSNTSNREMIIHLFGTYANGDPVRVEVTGFRPFLFVALPESECLTPTKESYTRNKIQDLICNKTQASNQGKYHFELVRKQKLIGYTGGKLFPFLKISVPSLGMFYDLRKILLDANQKPKLRLQQVLEVYESNIDPMLRFFHLRDIQPCGWISVNGFDTDSGLTALWENVSPSAAPAGVVTAPFKHAFWDIECYSHDKEFPMAQQGYRRVAKQLARLPEAGLVPAALKEGFAALVSKAQSTIKIPPLKKAVPLAKEIAKRVDSAHMLESLAEIWAKGGSKEAALTELLDKNLGGIAPIAGDPIIQIGTVAVSGSVVTKHIFVLGGCSPIPGAEVLTFDTESEL